MTSAAKFASLSLGLALGLTLASASASAQVVHRTSVVHQGQTVAVTYEPQVETQLRQIGIGPRSTAACMWTSKISVQRTATGADGRQIAALSRTIAGEKTRTGQRVGHCATMSEREKTRFAGSTEAMRAHVVTAADRDTRGLHNELASLASLGTGDSHAR